MDFSDAAGSLALAGAVPANANTMTIYKRARLMTDTPTPPQRPATEDELIESLAFALRYEGRKRVHHADDMMARITAERLVRHLRGSGFVLMKDPAARPPTSSAAPTPAT